MIALHERFRPNTNEVAAKIMDGEAIIINLANGTYYSMDGVGAAIWGMIEKGFSLEKCVALLLVKYGVSREKVEADVKRLAGELLEENLIIRSDKETPEQNQPGQNLHYESPNLNIYRDMGDLLALDPPIPGLAETPWKESNEKDPDEPQG